MALYLHCGLCGRRQADGLLSRASWEVLERADGDALRACPACKDRHADWETRLLAGAGPAQDQPTFGTSYGVAG